MFMRLRFFPGFLTCLLACGIASVAPAPAAPDETTTALPATGTITYQITAFLDIEQDELIFKRNTVRWHHHAVDEVDLFQYVTSAPGRFQGENVPTTISSTLSGVPVLSNFAWTPAWPNPVPDPIEFDADSSTLSGLFPPLPSAPMTVTIDPDSFGNVFGSVTQIPTAANDFTLIVTALNIGRFAAPITISLTVVPQQPNLAPILMPTPGTYTFTQNVSFLDADPAAVFHYTTDGSTPTTSSPTFTNPIPVGWENTIRALATFPSGPPSAVTTGSYTILPIMPLPEFSLSSGTYAAPQTVAINPDPPYCAHAVCDSFYKLTGPGFNTSWTPYQGPITLPDGGIEVLQAFSRSFHLTQSPIAVANYRLNGPMPTRTGVSISGAAGNYTLTADVSGRGKPAPSGTVTFVDAANGNASLGSKALQSTPVTSLYRISNITSNVPAQVIVSGDFNNDGKTDLVTTAGPTATVLLSNGDGTFSPTVLAQSIVSYDTATVADFNGDGNLDIAVLGDNNGDFQQFSNLYVFLGKGDGTFPGFGVPTGFGNVYFGLATADFNGDGKPDLAVSSPSDPSGITILLGKGDGTFTASEAPYGSAGPNSLFVGDVNADGIPDILGPGPNGTITVLLGVGDGTFHLSSIPAPDGATGIGQIVSEDLNGDGKLDLVVTTDVGVVVLLNAGDGTFTPGFHVSAGPPISTADLNGDGKPDLMAQTGNGYLQAWYGNGDGTFTEGRATSTQATGTGFGYFGLAVADFNLDGVADVAVGGQLNNVGTLLGELTTKASISNVSLAGPGTHSVVATYSGDATHGPSTSQPVTPSKATGIPLFFPPSGTYGFTILVSIGNVSPDATTYYTLDGSTPTAASTKYTGPVAVSWESSFKAYATSPGASNSPVASASYAIDRPAPMPTFSPAPGSYAAPQAVTLNVPPGSCPNVVCSIYFTLDGSTPSVHSTKYTGPVALSSAGANTIRAIADAVHYTPGPVAAATYTLH